MYRLRELRVRTRATQRASDAVAAERLLRDALSLWQGDVGEGASGSRRLTDIAAAITMERLEAAEDWLVAGCGRIVVQFFDVGCSRRLAWPDRPQAAALLTALQDPDRGFDAVVVGEYERAFYGDQLIEMMPVLLQAM